MDVRKKNTYEVLDMIEKNLISESDIIYYIENDYLDNQLLEDVMDIMFTNTNTCVNLVEDAESRKIAYHNAVKTFNAAYKNRKNNPEAFENARMEMQKAHKEMLHPKYEGEERESFLKHYRDKKDSVTASEEKVKQSQEMLKNGEITHEQHKQTVLDHIKNKGELNRMQKIKDESVGKYTDDYGKEISIHDPNHPLNLNIAKHEGYVSKANEATNNSLLKYTTNTTEKNSQIYKNAEDSLKKQQDELDQMKKEKEDLLSKSPINKQDKIETKVEAPKQEALKVSKPKAEPVKTEAPKQTETGNTETQKPGGGDEHADGIWEKIKGGYHTIKKAAGEHLEAAKKYAMEHPGVAGAGAAGAAVAGLAAYAGYKHLKNKKVLTSAHEDAHKVAMDSISKTHGHLSGEAAAHIHSDIHNVINSNKEMFKKDPRKSKEQLINHFGSDEYKKHLISKLSK